MAGERKRESSRWPEGRRDNEGEGRRQPGELVVRR